MKQTTTTESKPSQAVKEADPTAEEPTTEDATKRGPYAWLTRVWIE